MTPTRFAMPVHGAGVRVVHALRWFDGRPACGAPKQNVVPTEKPITCRACKRTRTVRKEKRA